VTLTSKSTLQEVAVTVGAHLNRRGIRAVLTGGACVAIHTGTYVSKDADYVIQSNVRQQTLEDALGELGFSRRGDQYVHPEVPFFIEFPPGPLSIGDDLNIVPTDLTVGGIAALGLSATDSCRDRLAAFYHWDDRQALELAVDIARKQPVDLDVVRRWSDAEGKADEHDEFLRKVAQERRRRVRRRRGKSPVSRRHP
jgi:hypothetical protein